MRLKQSVNRLLIGGVAPLGPRAVPSGIRKSPVASAELGLTGFIGDKQGDPKRHGGIEKAVHQYCLDHYAFWRKELGDLDVLGQPGAFGENLSVAGMNEDDICVGDQWALGDTVIQVSQARQPCWKLNTRFGVPDMARRLQHSGKTGWYYRVLEPGLVRENDQLHLLHRPNPLWPISRLITVLYTKTRDRRALEAMSVLEGLSDGWQRLAARRLETGQTEDWSSRLGERK
ncbi:MOSC domain-containing protein [Halomonas salipaludis]|uniref:MOSC domain-containing protein n=1 Tax=Halomonas salipaludis TaxID=2032625 RepID=UPI00159630BF|nr:MOSC domain-containing protein [Halomonas salipaludis]